MKTYAVTLYNENGIEKKSWFYGTKREQLEKYHLLIYKYKKTFVEKYTLSN